MNLPAGLPGNVERVLRDFCDAARNSFGSHFVSVVLFGSAAEGKLRETSDVNVIVVLSEFLPAEAKQFAPSLGLARAAVRLQPMFLLTSEIMPALSCFAAKFADILRRHIVLTGADPFQALHVPRDAQIFQLRQALLNLVLRTRTGYAERAVNEDQVASLIASASGPLRVAAATLLNLEEQRVLPPKEALRHIVEGSAKQGWSAALDAISAVREKRPIASPPSDVVIAIGEIAAHLLNQAESLV